MEDNKTFFQKAEKNKLDYRDIFGEVFRCHSKEENARLFLAGTPMTTPDDASMLAKWIKPYMFARILLVGLLLVIVSMMMGNALMMPFIFVAGSFLVPVAVMLFYWEMNIPRTVSFATVIYIFLVGGILSLVFTTVLNGLQIQGTLYVGIAEETAKIMAAALWLRGRDKKYILSGMLIGAAVGAGFAAIESAGYAIILGGWSLDTMVLRAILAPGGHVTWAAITGGSLVWAKGEEPLSVRHFLNPGFLKAYAFCVITHALWDSFPMVFIFVDCAVIMVVGYALLKKGVSQVVAVSKSMNDDHLTQALDYEPLKLLDLEGNSDPYVRNSKSQVVEYRLQWTKGSLAGHRYDMKKPLRIGRDRERCNIPVSLDTPGVSGLHCVVMCNQKGVFIKDLGSAYGTYVNGKRLQIERVYELKLGYRVCLGSAKEEFMITGKGGVI